MKRKGEAADRLIGRMVNTGATSSQLNRKGAALARVARNLKRDRRDSDYFVLLTMAQRIFAFRSLKQLTYFIGRWSPKAVRQKSRGRRRYVSVSDIAALLEFDDPRGPQSADETVPDDDGECDGGDDGQDERPLAKCDSCRFHWRADRLDAAERQLDHMASFLKEMGQYAYWEKRWNRSQGL